MLVSYRPSPVDLFQAEGRSHQIAQLPAIRAGTSASDESKCTTDVITYRDMHIFKVKFVFEFWLPVSPARPVRLRIFIGQWGQDIVDYGVLGVPTENFIEPALTRVLRPKLEDFAN